MNKKINIAVFKPYNAKTTNPFCTGQHPFFKELQKNYNYQITYFIDDEKVKFDGVGIKYIKKNKIKTFLLLGLRKIFNRRKYYWKIPYYEDLDFSRYDLIITEGIHYLLLDYFRGIAEKVILNDSISRDYILSSIQRKYLNRYFSKSLAVTVNDKIPILYRKNGLNLNALTIGHSLNINLISFIKRAKCKGNLISVGRLVPEKGFEYIIRAINILKRKYPEIKLDIYGTGSGGKEIQNLIRLLGLEKAVFLKGFLSYKNLISMLKNYDLFVSHPLETPHIAEAFLMANMEAMANGLPVITSNCGGVPYTVKDKAVVVEQKNINQIIKAVEDFMNSPDRAEKYSLAGRKYIEENYSVRVIAVKWDKAIREFVKNNYFYGEKTRDKI